MENYQRLRDSILKHESSLCCSTIQLHKFTLPKIGIMLMSKYEQHAHYLIVVFSALHHSYTFESHKMIMENHSFILKLFFFFFLFFRRSSQVESDIVCSKCDHIITKINKIVQFIRLRGNHAQYQYRCLPFDANKIRVFCFYRH